MSDLSKFRFADTAITTKGSPIPELGLKYNPFPAQATVSITSPDEKLNGGRFDPKVRSSTVTEFQEKFINIDFKDTQHLRLGFLWSARIETTTGFGKTALLAHYYRKINKNYGGDLSSDQKVVAMYAQPEPSTNSLKKLAELICNSLLFLRDPIIGSATLSDVIKTIRFRVIKERPPATLFTNVLLPEFKTIEDFDRLVDPQWVDRDWHIAGLHITMKDYLLEEAGVNEELAEILAHYHDKAGFKLDRYMKRRPLEFLFGDAVSLLKLAGFNGAYLFIDDFFRGIESTTERGRDIFAKQIRSWVFDSPNSRAAMEGFYTVIMTFHPDLERSLANSWRRAGLHEIASFDIDRSPGNNLELGLLDQDDTIRLLKAYTEPAIENEEMKKQNPLHPLNKTTALLIATPPVKPRQLLNDAFELIEQAKRDKVKGEITQDYVEKFVQERGLSVTVKNDDLENFIDTRFG